MSATAGIGLRNSSTTKDASSSKRRAPDDHAGENADDDREREPSDVGLERLRSASRSSPEEMPSASAASVSDGGETVSWRSNT